MKLKFLLVLAVLLPPSATWAQCAPGVPSAGNPGCIPLDRPNSPYFQGNPDQLQNQDTRPRPVWADRWGAIATDEKTGDAGTVEGLPNKRDAERTALSICARNGAKNCRVDLTFHNQCAAAALGNGKLSEVGRASKEEAEQAALSRCGSSCKIVYSACSLPERIQ